MSLIEFACLTLGVLNGVFFAIMPKMDNPRPSILKLFGLGSVLAAALMFLAIAATMDNFVRTSLLTVVLGLLTFAITKPLYDEAQSRALVTPSSNGKELPFEQRDDDANERMAA